MRIVAKSMIWSQLAVSRRFPYTTGLSSADPVHCILFPGELLPDGYRSCIVIIVMVPHADDAAVDRVVKEIERMGAQAHLSRGQFRTIIGAVGEEGNIDQNHLATLDQVEKVVPIMKPYKLASREFHEEDSVIEIGGGNVPKVKVGGPHAMCIAGPCAVENQEMLNKIARQ